MTEIKPVKWRSKPSLPDNSHYTVLPEGYDPSQQLCIEQGYFVFTMMPSLRCSLNCPHCYLSLDQRRNSPIMSMEQLEVACSKVDAYYQDRPHIKHKTIIFYWYGGEPTDMGQDYFLEAFEMIARIFTEEKGYYVRHDVLTSLLNIDESWFDIFRTWGRGHFQTSFDGLMRGKGYMKKWDSKVRKAVDSGLSVSTISVVNHELMEDGPKAVLDYLIELGIREASFLPFMLNEQNEGEKYEKFAPSMQGYSEFMIELTEYWYHKIAQGESPPYIGQHVFIASQAKSPMMANIAAQTLFLLPEGDFVLPDYKNGYLEFMRPFGNIFDLSFEEILDGKERTRFLRKQHLRDMNKECLSCEHSDKCIMEFWKQNRAGDECFGAKSYVEWVIRKEKEVGALSKEGAMLF